MKKDMKKIALIMATGILTFSGAFGLESMQVGSRQQYQIEPIKHTVGVTDNYYINQIKIVNKIQNREVTLKIENNEGKDEKNFKKGQSGTFEFNAPLKKLNLSILLIKSKRETRWTAKPFNIDVTFNDTDNASTIADKLKKALEEAGANSKPRNTKYKGIAVTAQVIDNHILEFTIDRPNMDEEL